MTPKSKNFRPDRFYKCPDFCIFVFLKLLHMLKCAKTEYMYMYVCMCIYIYIYVCVCVCVCVYTLYTYESTSICTFLAFISHVCYMYLALVCLSLMQL